MDNGEQPIRKLSCADAAGTTEAVFSPVWGANILAFSYRPADLAEPIPILEAVDLDAVAAKPTSFGIPLLGPTPGRVGKNQTGIFDYQGRSYRIEPARHGHLRNLPWQLETIDASSAACSVQIVVRPDGLDPELFPFDYHVHHIVTVSPRCLSSTIEIRNTGKIVQPIAFGWHPYLHRSGDCVVSIPAAKRWLLDEAEEATPTGELADVSGADDFRAGRLLKGSEHWDDVFAELEPTDGRIVASTSEDIRVRQADGMARAGLVRRIVSAVAPGDTQPGVRSIQLYTPPGRAAIAIEPLSAPPNAINLAHPAYPVCALEPAASVSFRMDICIELEW